VVLPAVPNTNRGLIENLFLLYRKPHEVLRASKLDRKSGERSGGTCGSTFSFSVCISTWKTGTGLIAPLGAVWQRAIVRFVDYETGSRRR
jgi:hypothetical protein